MPLVTLVQLAEFVPLDRIGAKFSLQVDGEGYLAVAQKDILNGWKEIAGYVARDIRTVERWEKQRGLPVRRVPGAGRATVYARISELEEWLASKPLENEIVSAHQENVHPEATPAVSISREMRVEEPFTHAPVPAAVHAAPTRGTRTLLYMSLVLACLLVPTAFLLLRHARASAEATSGAPKAAVIASVPHSVVPGVEESYLRGSYLVEQRTPESLSQALESFQSAIAHDPGYAPGYAGLASTYNLLREYSVMPDADAYPKAREAAERAIALDPDLAEAHVSLAFVTYYGYLDAAKAEQEFKTAIALDPSLSQAHHWYGSVLTHEGRFAEALHELDIAQHQQPASSAILTSRAFALGLSGHSEQARAMLRDLLSHNGYGNDPNSATTHHVLAIVSLGEPRDLATFLSECHKVATLKKHDSELLDFLNSVEPAYKNGGEKAFFQASLQFEKQRHPRAGDVTLRMAQAEANLGEIDEAFRDLNRMVDQHDTVICGISLDPLLKPLHGDPRYAELRARLGLPKLTA